MAEELLGKFRCVVLTSRAKLLDCKTHSITLPAHDGQMGVLQNHMPMLCKLGIGVMEVRDFITDDNQIPDNTYFLIDGGFARISHNLITVLAYDVIVPSEITAEKAEKMLDEANKLPVGDANALQRRQREIKKATILLQMVQASATLENSHGIPA
jgi:F-type H+-transporting ATPase subunit epsilon